MERREFIRLSAAAALASSFPLPTSGEERNAIAYRRMGETGENVSCVGLGGAHIGYQKEDKESVRILRVALHHGIKRRRRSGRCRKNKWKRF